MKSFLRTAFLLFASAILLSACKGEKKITSYSDVYSEQPTTVYIAPVVDKAQRRAVKYPSDEAYNNELNTAAAYLYQTLPLPLQRKGYYVIGPVASQEIASATALSDKDLKERDLSLFRTDYGIDAVLIVTIHRWREENGKWIACLEYQLRSTKSNNDLLHTWVLATKALPTNLKGDPIVMNRDKQFAKKFEFDNGTAQRSFLVEKVNDFILRDLPFSVQRRQFEKDLYRLANATYLKYTWTEDGGADVQPCEIEEYEEKAFL